MSNSLPSLKEIFLADQADRENEELKKLPQKERWEAITPRDLERKEQVIKILENKKDFSGEEYFYAGMVFQHTATLDDLLKVQELALKAAELGYEKGKWLYAAGIDRYLIQKGKKQKYGTQFRFDEKTNDWIQFPLNGEATEEEKKAFGVKPIQEMKSTLMNKTREKE